MLSLLQRPQNPGVESIVISFAQKTFANGQLTSKLHVIELGAPAGESRHARGFCCNVQSTVALGNGQGFVLVSVMRVSLIGETTSYSLQ